jgi:hypothetical protein
MTALLPRADLRAFTRFVGRVPGANVGRRIRQHLLSVPESSLSRCTAAGRHAYSGSRTSASSSQNPMPISRYIVIAVAKCSCAS